MPRPKKPGAPEPKRRSRKGCWPCKARKVKCGEEKPSCSNCRRQGETCDYSIRLNWDGRTKKKSISGIPQNQTDSFMTGVMSFNDSSNQTTQSAGSDKLQGLPSAKLLDGSSTASTPPGLGPGESNSGKTTSTSPPGFQPRNSPQSTVHQSPNSKDSLIEDITSKPAESKHARHEGVSQPHTPSLGHHGSYPYPSPTDSTLTSPSQGPTSTMGYHPVTQQVSYLRQTQPQDSQLGSSLSPHDEPFHQHIGQAGLSSGFTEYEGFPHGNAENSEMNVAGGMDNLHRNPHTHSVSSHSRHNIPSSSSRSGSVSERGAHFHGTNGPSSQNRTSIHSPSSQLNVHGETSDLSSGVFTSSRFGSSFNTPEIVDNFGLDCGDPDLDLARNSDEAAVKDISSLDTSWINKQDTNCTKSELGLQKSETVFAKGGYYSFPVLINIPRHLTPLPAQLLDNPMNLLYFHHFLNHTARILVPHDCSDNPFRVVLPSMAVEDTNLLNLLLAYAASHRARLLGHDEPSNRIAHLVRDVFPSLRQDVDNMDDKTADTRVATALMLTSLKIISPSTFDVPIPWQDHLRVARNLFVARGGTQLGQPATKVGYFLARWLAYLDILGSLSCRKNDLPIFSSSYWAARAAEKGSSDKSGFHVDCFTGFSPLCSSLLARLGELTHHCYTERIDENGTLQWEFNPSMETKAEGERLLDDMKNALLHEYSFSAQHQISKPDDPEMAASNHAFHWAGIIHLYRRVLDRSQEDEDVVVAVKALLDTLFQVRRGGTAEVCLLFPLFTAGCETRDPEHRRDILERIKSFEGVGMKQIRNARELMERSWAQDLPWILLTEGEFLG